VKRLEEARAARAKGIRMSPFAVVRVINLVKGGFDAVVADAGCGVGDRVGAGDFSGDGLGLGDGDGMGAHGTGGFRHGSILLDPKMGPPAAKVKSQICYKWRILIYGFGDGITA